LHRDAVVTYDRATHIIYSAADVLPISILIELTDLHVDTETICYSSSKGTFAIPLYIHVDRFYLGMFYCKRIQEAGVHAAAEKRRN
jgi:hypothetical protein